MIDVTLEKRMELKLNISKANVSWHNCNVILRLGTPNDKISVLAVFFTVFF